eukprot:7189813-Alexandrium_andersonii.AAC.1
MATGWSGLVFHSRLDRTITAPLRGCSAPALGDELTARATRECSQPSLPSADLAPRPLPAVGPT